MMTAFAEVSEFQQKSGMKLGHKVELNEFTWKYTIIIYKRPQ